MAKQPTSIEPLVGQTVKIKKTLYGGNHPQGGKIRIYPPAIVEVLSARSRTSRDPQTNQVRSTRLVRVRDIRTGEVYPEFKMGSLLHAAELVEAEERPEGRVSFELQDYRRRQLQEVEEINPAFSGLAALKAQLEAEEVTG